MEESKKRKIRFFTSFEEAKAAELKDGVKLTGEENLALSTALTKKKYNYKPQKYFRIYFDKVE